MTAKEAELIRSIIYALAFGAGAYVAARLMAKVVERYER